MCAYTSPDGGKEGEPAPIPDEMADARAEYREKLLDEVVQTDEALMEQYLEGEELDSHEVAPALKVAITRGEVFPVACGVATKNLGTHALLDLIVEGVPSPAKKVVADRSRAPTRPRSSSRRSPTRSPAGSTSSASSRAPSTPTRRSSTRATHAKERMGDAAVPAGQGAHRREGVRRGRHRRGREAEGRADRRPAARPGGRRPTCRRSASPSR